MIKSNLNYVADKAVERARSRTGIFKRGGGPYSPLLILCYDYYVRFVKCEGAVQGNRGGQEIAEENQESATATRKMGSTAVARNCLQTMANIVAQVYTTPSFSTT